MHIAQFAHFSPCHGGSSCLLQMVLVSALLSLHAKNLTAPTMLSVITCSGPAQCSVSVHIHHMTIFPLLCVFRRYHTPLTIYIFILLWISVCCLCPSSSLIVQFNKMSQHNFHLFHSSYMCNYQKNWEHSYGDKSTNSVKWEPAFARIYNALKLQNSTLLI